MSSCDQHGHFNASVDQTTCEGGGRDSVRIAIKPAPAVHPIAFEWTNPDVISAVITLTSETDE